MQQNRVNVLWFGWYRGCDLLIAAVRHDRVNRWM
jgi:hypothetical protein